MTIPRHIQWRSTGTTLGAGGQGQVHLVVDERQPESKKYALKVLRNTSSQQARERFRREIEVVKRLNSNFVVKVIDHSQEEDEFQYYVMEYFNGARTLSSIIFAEGSPYYRDVSRCLDMFEQILAGIRACEASRPQVVHRDIKPDNILVLQDGSIRLIDFGVCQIDDGEMMTLVDENVGARNYTSPECEAGSDDFIGIHSDIYSAAKVLWAAITSRQAFAREDPVFTNRSMEAMLPQIPETWHLTHIFERTIRRNPADRFQSVGEALELVRHVRNLVQSGIPPLKILSRYCPSCGWPTVSDFPRSHEVFGNPNPPGVRSLMCNLCGFGFVRNMEIWRENLERRESLS